MLKRGFGPVEFLYLILGEIADAHASAGRHRTIHRGKLRGEQPSQGGLAIAIAAEKGNPVIGIDPQVKPLEHGCLAIADCGKIERDKRRAQLVRIREIELQGRIVDHLRNRLQLG